MSYKAFGALKQHVEIGVLKSMSYEEINVAMNELASKIRSLEKENAALKAAEVAKTAQNSDYAAALRIVKRWELGNGMGAGPKVTFEDWLEQRLNALQSGAKE